MLSRLLKILPQCSGVITSMEEITASPPGVTSVFFRMPVIFTARSAVADDQVSSRLTNCINTAKTNYKGFLDQKIPAITEGDNTYNKYNSSTISSERSCCGGDIPPPCCTAGSIKVSRNKCGKTPVCLFLSFFLNLAVLLPNAPISNSLNMLNLVFFKMRFVRSCVRDWREVLLQAFFGKHFVWWSERTPEVYTYMTLGFRRDFISAKTWCSLRYISQRKHFSPRVR